MGIQYRCDICGKTTTLYPPTEPLWDEHKVEVSLPYTEEEPDPNNPARKVKVLKYKTETQVTKVPKLSHIKRQNATTGEVEEIPIQDVKDLQPRTFFVRLNIGQETIQKDFCKECLSEVMIEAQALWDKLASIKDIK
jgi:hypothetical protein